MPLRAVKKIVKKKQSNIIQTLLQPTDLDEFFGKNKY